MRDDQRRQRLVDSNPWWRAASAGEDPTAWTTHHRVLRNRSEYDLGFRPTILDDIQTGPVTNLLTVLTGPRRIGKSVALLDVAATLCARADLDPRQVVYLPCDGMNAQDVHRSLVLAREVTRAIDFDQPKPRVWLLDEISGVTGWTTTLKLARDITTFGDDTVVATGSRWVAGEDVEGNLFAGRAGTTSGRRTRLLLPMTFRDFLTTSRRMTPALDPVHVSELQSPAVARALDGIGFDIDAYDLAWQDYLTCGGFPRAVAEHTRNGTVSDNYLDDIRSWLRIDVDPEGPQDSVPRLLSEITSRSTSPLNIANIAKELGQTRKVAERRLHRLISSHAALWCPRREGDRIVAGSQSKLYLTDPLLASLPSRLRAGLPTPDMTRLTEMTIGVALARAIDDLEEGRWVSGDTIGYARTAREGEVDLGPVTVPSAAGTIPTVPIESKWVDQGWKGESKTIDGKYGRGILATKSVLDVSGNVWAVPAPFVALLLQ
ncbi:MAG: AAA family ATPase [Aeromicrobium sp.]|uniref:AAA family ATPase n=1 Tax=Aeromicrobium sp. TaxID=1871063 RepID=UPI0039E40FBB